MPDTLSFIISAIFSFLASWFASAKLKNMEKNSIKKWSIVFVVFTVIFMIVLSLSEAFFFNKSFWKNKKITNHQSVNDRSKITAKIDYFKILKKYREEFLSLRTSFEELYYVQTPLDEKDKTYIVIKQELLTKAPKLIKKIESLPNNSLKIGYVLLKYDLLNYLEAIYCELLDSLSEKLNHVELGLKYNSRVFELIEEINKKKNSNGYYRSLFEWILNDNVTDRNLAIKAWLYAIRFLSDGEITAQEQKEIKRIMSKIGIAYLTRNPLRRNPSLKYFLK